MNSIQKTLETVTSRILTDMYFLFTDEDMPPGQSVPSEGALGFAMSLGEPQGTELQFYFLFSGGLAQEMAENFVGTDRESSIEEQIPGTLQECVNMVVGNLLNELDPDGQFRMGLPRKVEERPAWVSGEPSIRLSYSGNPLHIWMGRS